MYEINNEVIFVKGAKRGAIYDFNSKKVFSINTEACLILNDYCQNIIRKENQYYIDLLTDQSLISKNFQPRVYIPKEHIITKKVAWLEITSACNLNCIHCYEGCNHKAVNNPISLNAWEKVVDELIAFDFHNMIIIGGEPFMSPILEEILKYTCSKNANVTLFTNATLLDDRIINTIRETGASVKISIYGHCSEVHDKITQKKGSFKKTISNIEKLVKAGIEVIPAIIIMKENEIFLHEIIDFSKAIGMNYEKYDVIRSVFGGTQSAHIPHLSKEIKNYIFRTKPSFRASKDFFSMAYYYNTCWCGKLVITESGDILPCEFERDICFGNIRNTSLRDIINNSVVQDCWGLNYSQIDECKVCEYRFACKDCRPLGKSVSGNIYKKNPRCLYNPYEGIWESPNPEDDTTITPL